MIESAIPTIVFVIMVAIDREEIRRAAIVAVVVAVILAIARLLRGQTVRYVASGVVGVALAAFIAARTGRAENFFLPGLLLNIAYGGAFIASALARRPLTGYIAASLTGREPFGDWHRDPASRIPASRAAWVIAAVFLARLAVQIPLYLTDSLVALGTAKVAMGVPLLAVGVWLSWLLMRQSPLLRSTPEPPADPE